MINLKTFIEKNALNPNISLTMIADEFNINESYLSRTFKESFKTNLSSFIENIRMREAVLLFTNTNYSIQAISEKVGYSNVNSFYKAFKRVHKISPANFRENN